MENQTHSLGIIPLSLSKLLERFAFYGMRSIILLYATSQLQISREHASWMYGIFVGLSALLPILGGLIGDLLLSTRTTAIIGGFIEALGCFVLTIPNQAALYTSMLLIAVGAALHGPNITSTVASLYKNRKEKMDAAILILYISINIGAVLGGFLLGFASDYMGYRIAFIACGVICAGSQIILLLSSNLLKDASKKANLYLEENTTTVNIGLRIIIVLVTIFASSIYWRMNDFSLNPVLDRIAEIENFYPAYFTVSTLLNAAVIIFGGIILAIIYSFVKSTSLLKIVIGFIIFAFSVLVLLLCQNSAISTSFIAIILFSLFLQSISELFIAPIVLSVICQYGPAKFNSTLIAAFSGISSLFSYATAYLIRHTGSFGNTVSLLISICIALFLSAVFGVLYLLIRKNKTAN